MHRISLPLIVQTGVKETTTFSLNLNEYRNAHYLVLNNAKIAFKAAVKHLITPLPVFDWVELEYIFFPGSAREMDTANFVAIVDKFFCDAFVEFGKLPDDNYKFIRRKSEYFEAIDRNNPRVDVVITGSIKEETMQLQALLNHDDFIAALNAYVRATFPIPAGSTPDIDITAGRGGKGYSAVVTYASAGDTNAPANAAVQALGAEMTEAGPIGTRLTGDPMPKVAGGTKAEKPAAGEVKKPEPVQEKPKEQPVEVAPTPEPEPTANLFSGAPANALSHVGSTETEAVEDELVEEVVEEAPAPAGKNKPLFDFG